MQTAPAAVIAGLEMHGPAGEKERLRLLTDQWVAMQPELIAIGAWLGSAKARESSARFMGAGHEALKQHGPSGRLGQRPLTRRSDRRGGPLVKSQEQVRNLIACCFFEFA